MASNDPPVQGPAPAVEPVADDPEESRAKFMDLCDDIVERIFFYLDEHRERVRFEQVNRRFGRMLPLTTIETGYLGYHNQIVEHRALMSEMKKCHNLRKIDVAEIKDNGLLADLIETRLGLDEYFGQIFENRTNRIEELKVTAYESTMNQFKLATEIARYNPIKELHLWYQFSRMSGIKEILEDTLQLFELCPQLNKLWLDLREVTAETKEAELCRECRTLMDVFWSVVREKLEAFELILYENCSLPWFGNRHWASEAFPKLKKLEVWRKQSPHYIRLICSNCPKLEELRIESEDFEAIEAITSLENLRILTWETHDDLFESDDDRLRNVRLFQHFIQTRGPKLQKLYLEIPFQNNDLFKDFDNYCTQLKHFNLTLKGFSTRFTHSIEHLKIKALRELTVDHTIIVKEFKELLEYCPKLEDINFYIAYFDRGLADVYRCAMVSFYRRTKRKIRGRVDFFGTNGWPDYNRLTENDNLQYDPKPPKTNNNEGEEGTNDDSNDDEDQPVYVELEVNDGELFRKRSPDWYKD